MRAICIDKKRPLRRLAGFLAAGAYAVLLAACSTTEQAKVSQAELKCGFLGPECTKLTPGEEGQVALR